MSRPQLPEDILPYRLADQGAEISGVVPTQRLHRLQAEQINLSEVWVDVKFDVDEEGRRTVSGRIQTIAQLVCQRCLRPMDWAIDVDFNMQLVAASNQLQSVPSHLEPWLVTPGERTDMASMLEDTLYLDFPMFPMHEPDVCSIKIEQSSEHNALGHDRDIIKPNPFEQLAALTKRQRK
jgi:uncharacterized protein